MKLHTLSCFKVTVSITCFLLTLMMVSYWIYKFGIEDRDIGVVDYIPITESEDIERPNLAICLSYPFLEKRFVENYNFSSSGYIEYLKGDSFDKKFLKVDYENVTLDMKDYFLGGNLTFFNGTQLRLNETDLKHEVIFNGLYQRRNSRNPNLALQAHQRIIKCFTSSVTRQKSKSMKELRLFYDRIKLMKDLKRKWMRSPAISVFTNLIYRRQFLLQANQMHSFDMGNKNTTIETNLLDLEILKSRDSHNRRCLGDEILYDEYALRRHLQDVGCRAPYISPFDSFPSCNEKSDIKKSQYGYFESTKSANPKPCKRISSFNDDAFIVKSLNRDQKRFLIFGINYPDEIKVITQSKEVDVHSLIGNIGGYIGLFLGKFYDYFSSITIPKRYRNIDIFINIIRLCSYSDPGCHLWNLLLHYEENKSDQFKEAKEIS